jgi:putative hydrolase of the HAD superfamily
MRAARRNVGGSTPAGAPAPYAARMISAVLFDFGGVILSSPFEAFEAYERRAGLPPGTIRRINATDHERNAWARLERNECSVEEFVEAFEDEAAAMGHRVDGRAVLACLAGELRPEMVTAVRRCAEHVATGLLTNNVVGHTTGSMGPEVESLLEVFDVVVESSRVGVRKPERRFYELALDALGVPAAEAVFLDDLGINLKPAREMGMHTIKVEDPGVAIAELEAVTGFDLR